VPESPDTLALAVKTLKTTEDPAARTAPVSNVQIEDLPAVGKVPIERKKNRLNVIAIFCKDLDVICTLSI
jgi:hypothetical protein